MSIAALVTELTVYTTDGENYGPSLLEQLHTARTSSLGGATSGASSSDSRNVFNVGAHNLWYQTVELAELMFSQAVPDTRPSLSPMLNLQQWALVFLTDLEAGAVTQMQHAVARERLLKWCDDIRDLIAPPKSGRLPGVQCPNCGLSRYTSGEGDSADDGPAIGWVFRPGGELTASCRNPECVDRITGYPSEWAGDTAIVQLGRLSGQTIDVDRIRESMAPVEEVPYDDGSKLVVTPEDPLYHAVVASMGGE